MGSLIGKLFGAIVTRIFVWWCAGFIFFPYAILPVLLLIAVVYPSHFIEYKGHWYAKSDWLWASYPGNHHVDWIYTACYLFMVCVGLWLLTAFAYLKPLMEYREKAIKQNAPGVTESALPTQ